MHAKLLYQLSHDAIWNNFRQNMTENRFFTFIKPFKQVLVHINIQEHGGTHFENNCSF